MNYKLSVVTPIGTFTPQYITKKAEKIIAEALQAGKTEIKFEGVIKIEKKDSATTDEKIEDAVKYCKTNGIKLTVRNITQYAGVSIATVSRHTDRGKGEL